MSGILLVEKPSPIGSRLVTITVPAHRTLQPQWERICSVRRRIYAENPFIACLSTRELEARESLASKYGGTGEEKGDLLPWATPRGRALLRLFPSLGCLAISRRIEAT